MDEPSIAVVIIPIIFSFLIFFGIVFSIIKAAKNASGKLNLPNMKGDLFEQIKKRMEEAQSRIPQHKKHKDGTFFGLESNLTDDDLRRIIEKALEEERSAVFEVPKAKSEFFSKLGSVIKILIVFGVLIGIGFVLKMLKEVLELPEFLLALESSLSSYVNFFIGFFTNYGETVLPIIMFLFIVLFVVKIGKWAQSTKNSQRQFFTQKGYTFFFDQVEMEKAIKMMKTHILNMTEAKQKYGEKVVLFMILQGFFTQFGESLNRTAKGNKIP